MNPKPKPPNSRVLTQRGLLAATRLLRSALDDAFCEETRAPDFVANGPSAGQCAAVAVIVHDKLGGKFVSVEIGGNSHWYNRVKIGDEWMDVDLTGDQFGLPAVQVGKRGELHPNTKVRRRSELKRETIERARLLARRAGVRLREFCWGDVAA